MYCGHCGSLLEENGRFCGKCGSPIPVKTETKVIYEEEKRLPAILDNKAVVALTFCVLVLSIATIICASLLTKDLPVMRTLSEIIVLN